VLRARSGHETLSVHQQKKSITPAQNPNSEFLVDPIGSDPIHYSSVALVVFQFQAFYATWPTLDCFLPLFA
jgi:hypothetical protein